MQTSRHAGASLALGAVLLGALPCCNEYNSSDDSTPVVQTLAANGISVSLTYESDWKSGYCSQVSITNTGLHPFADWEVVINLGQAQLAQLRNAISSFEGSKMTVTSPSANAAIAVGDSATFEFCANAAGPNYHPTLESAAASKPTADNKD